MEDNGKNNVIVVTEKKRKTTTNSQLRLDNDFSDVSNKKFMNDLANDIEMHTAPFESAFKSQKKNQRTPIKDEYANVHSSVEYRFFSKIPKPDSNYSIMSNKYPELPSKIPKYKLN